MMCIWKTAKVRTVSFIHIKEGNGDSIAVFVSDDVRCDDFTLEIQGGEAWWKADMCIDVNGRSLPSGYGDDPEGWLHLGTIEEVEDGAEYTITTSHDVVLVGWEVVEEWLETFSEVLLQYVEGQLSYVAGYFS